MPSTNRRYAARNGYRYVAQAARTRLSVRGLVGSTVQTCDLNIREEIYATSLPACPQAQGQYMVESVGWRRRWAGCSRRMSEVHFIEVNRCPKKRCFAPLS